MAELRDDADVHPPLRSDTPWIAAEPRLQKQRIRPSTVQKEGEDQRRTNLRKDLGGVKTTPVRNLESGAFVLEMWIEEGKAKFEE